GKGEDTAVSVVLSPDGTRVFVTGFSVGSSDDVAYATVAYDASTGAWLWAKRYKGPGSRYNFPTSLGVGPDGNAVFVTGWSRSFSSEFNYATLAYDASTGEQLWAKRYNGPGNGYDLATAIAVHPDGTAVFVTGRSLGSGSWDFATIAYSTS